MMNKSIEWNRIRCVLELTEEFVVAQLGIEPALLKSIENGEESPEVGLAEDLAGLYGIPFTLMDNLAEEASVAGLNTLQVLFKSRPGGPRLTESDRASMARATAAAAEFSALERRLGRPSRFQRLEKRIKGDSDYSGWPAGKRLADSVRESLLNTDAPIRDIIDLAWREFGILVLPCELSGPIAAFSFADHFRGPTIVYNMHEAHENIWVLRFTLAHEICHVLFDRDEHEPLGWYTAFDDMGLETTGDRREIRANAFAVHFLMPYSALATALMNPQVGATPEQMIRTLMDKFGLNLRAMQRHLKNFNWLDADATRQLRRINPKPSEEWFSDLPPDKDFFPVPSIPVERRGLMAREVVRAWSKGEIDGAFLREILRAAPGEPFATLPGVYDLTPPAEAA